MEYEKPGIFILQLEIGDVVTSSPGVEQGGKDEDDNNWNWSS